jgi:hypothetical protein
MVIDVFIDTETSVMTSSILRIYRLSPFESAYR